jgi:hypothetical protein
MNFLTKSVVLGWLWRRAQELAGWVIGLLPLFLSLPAAHQETILSILRGEGGGLSISAYGGLALYLFSQWQSFRATVKDQVVAGGKKVALPELGGATQVLVEEKVETAVERRRAKPNLLQILFGKRV